MTKAFDLKTSLFMAASVAFPDPLEVHIRTLRRGDPKLVARKMPPQLHLRVTGLKATGMGAVEENGRLVPRRLELPCAVAGMLPMDAAEEDIQPFIDMLLADAQRMRDQVAEVG